jgi:hypothetical protein
MLSNNKAIQQADLAGKTKLTAVTMGHGNHRFQFFIPLLHDSRGKAILPSEVLNKILGNIPRGTTITTG